MADKSETGLICAFQIDAQGAAHARTLAQIDRRSFESEGWLWVHLDRAQDETLRWLEAESGLPDTAIRAIMEEETRPRCVPMGDGALLIFRGVNMNPAADPHDMISIRLWITDRAVVSTRRYKLLAVQDIRDAFESGAGPRTVGELLVMLSDGLISRMAQVIERLDERLEALEYEVEALDAKAARAELVSVRQAIIPLRRYLAPQRDALLQLGAIRADWLADADRAQLKEAADRITRFVEDLDAMREHATLVNDALSARLDEQMNRTMFVLSIVAAIFLPLGLLTGLLGVNVAGMPGASNPAAFWIVCGLLVALAAVQLWLFRRLKLF